VSRKRLQLTASIAATQNLRTQGGRLELTLGCNLGCAVRVVGTAHRGARTFVLSHLSRSLAAAHAATVSLHLSAADLSALKRAGGTVVSDISVTATAPGESPRSYRTRVRLTSR
jgi:hypothetical protein